MPATAGAVLAPKTRFPSRLYPRHLIARLRSQSRDQRGSQVTDNLGLIVIGIVAIVAIGGLITGLDNTVFSWVSTQLGLG